MKTIITSLFIVICNTVNAQTDFSERRPSINLRVSFLLLPATPLITLEALTVNRLSIQLESNFGDTHGINLKYYQNESMNGTYFFTGMAWVEDDLLRENGGFTRLPYGGIGIADRFGRKGHYVFDGRFGIGPTLNADNNSLYPVIKLGVGRIF